MKLRTEKKMRPKAAALENKSLPEASEREKSTSDSRL
jgi:hypothetical protein